MFAIVLPGSLQKMPHTSTFGVSTLASSTFRVSIFAVPTLAGSAFRVSILADCIIAPASTWVRRLRRRWEARAGRET